MYKRQNPNIKSDQVTNKPGRKVIIPASKGGKARGRLGAVHIDNRTTFYIGIYVNGDLEGTVGPGGDLYWSATAGRLRLYGQAPGTTLDWGPTSLLILDGETSTWTLYP